jgi:hypothetical protein
MKTSLSRSLSTALLVAALSATAYAQVPARTPAQDEAAHGPRLSADALARLQDGRIAMAKTALKLNEAQLKLWAPVEEQIRAGYAARQAAMIERQQGTQLSLPDRLDRMGQHMAQGAERLKAFNVAFKPFYATLSDEQKAISGVVLREMRGHRGGHRWAMQRAPAAPTKQ